jgi:hypothetical protein
LALADVIETVSIYPVGDTATDKITNAQLTLLSALTSAQVTRLNPGFTGDELLLFQAYIILDRWENRSGKGQITEKTVKDTRWAVKGTSNTSVWMDLAKQMISDYKEKNSVSLYPSGVVRSDYDVKGFDNSEISQYGDLSGSL